ncbi:hypothetical protein E2I00_008634 [Balaenoptera physalus]|uniref:Cytochrome oxidase subunit II copper A binding domain-containing protein n=1 Tax=Balaenoptera physalus TaxID=9770 RepID=A0A643C8V9_BALPH|nr:hypothetical protein E2I00_008634 [Balaenoptera physalus]
MITHYEALNSDSSVIPASDLKPGELRLLEGDNRVVLPIEVTMRTLTSSEEDAETKQPLYQHSQIVLRNLWSKSYLHTYHLRISSTKADADHPRHLPSKPTRGTTPQHLSPISLRGTHHLILPQPHRRKPNTYAPSPFYDNCAVCLLHTSTSLRIVQNAFYNFRWCIWIDFLHGYRIPRPTWNDWFYFPNHIMLRRNNIITIHDSNPNNSKHTFHSSQQNTHFPTSICSLQSFTWTIPVSNKRDIIIRVIIIIKHPANPTRPRIPNPKKKKLYITILVILQIFLIITFPAVERILVYILFEATLVPTLTLYYQHVEATACYGHNNSKSTHRFQSISLSHPFLTRNNSHSLHFFTPNRLRVTHHIFISQLHSTSLENNKFLQTTALRLGAITTPFTATDVLTQNDIQKMVVFSTFSQVGLIIVTMA